MIGRTIAHYEIEARLGSGGMGDVYRARDSRLGRSVAVKTLPDAFAHDPDRVARFEREAKLLASLNHPNIAALYGLEQAAGQHFLVMELVEGDTLAERIARGPILIDAALNIAHQIAEACEAAHEKGVVHRDLKPANVKITPEGKVKVLDFGLAKALDSAPAQVMSDSPTLLSAATGVGVMLGTAGYMSPEQVRGHSADQRSDVFSFGCVFYEMLTGRQTFPGETVADIIGSIVAREPDLRALPANLNPRAHDLIRRCLAKNRRDRWHAVADLRLELEAIMADPHGVRNATVPGRPVWKLATAFSAAVVLLAAVTGFVVWNWRPAAPTAITRFSIVIPESERLLNSGTPILAMSPDGSNIAYIANQQLYLRSMSDLDTHLVEGTARGPYAPFFSPDGHWIGFFSRLDGKFEKVAVSGGAPVPICDAEFRPWSATWGADDRIYFASPGTGILRVPANGGTVEIVVPAKRGEYFSSPQLLPDGDGLMFSVARTSDFARWDKAQIIVQSLKSGGRKVVFEGGSDARYVPTGHLVYALGSTLYAVRFDVRTLQVAGGPLVITQRVRRSIDATSAAAHFAFSNTGSMVYVPGGPSLASGARLLAIVDRKGVRKPLPIPSGLYAQPRVSPDGKQLALYTDNGSDSAIQIYDFSGTSPLRRLTFTGRNYKPIWTPDGQRVVYSSDRDGEEAIYSQRADGAGSAERLVRVEPGASPQSEAWTLDGTLIVNIRIGGRSGGLATFIPGQDQQLKMLIPGGGNPSVSPDGKWIAYPLLDNVRQNVYVQAFPPNGSTYSISAADQGGNNPLWSRGGKELYYLTLDTRQVMAVDVRKSGPGLAFGNPTPLPIEGISGPGPRPYDIMPDGTFIALFPDGQASPARPQVDQLNITLNWFSELRQRVPVKSSN
jgi:serine/threonine-protein kinase